MGAENVKDLPGVGEVRASLLHRRPELAESTRRARTDLLQLRLDGNDPEVGAEGDPCRRPRLRHRLSERAARRRQGEGVHRVPHCLRVEHQGDVGHRAPHGSLHVQGVPDLPDGSAAGARRHASRARPQSDHRAERGGGAQAASQIGAGREPHLAGSEGGGGAAGRSAARQRRVPGIEGLSEDFVEGVGAVPELRGVRLGNDDATAPLQVLHQEIGTLGHVIGEDRRPQRGAYAGHVDQVLDRDGEPREVPRRILGGRPLRRQPARMVPGPIETQGRQGVDSGIGGLDARGRGVDRLQGRDLAAAEQIHDGACIKPDQLAHVRCRGCCSSRWRRCFATTARGRACASMDRARPSYPPTR